VLVSAAATPTAVEQNGGTSEELRTAIADLTAARYGRDGKELDLNDAVERGMRATTRVASQHTWWAQALTRLKGRAGALRDRAWAR
jgi:hypothetical protein